MTRLIQIADRPGADLGEAVFVSFEGAFLGLGDVVMIQCPTGRVYFGQIAAPQENHNRDGLGPLDVTSLNPLELVLQGRLSRDVPVNEMHLYRALLLKEVTRGE